jgi:glycosyltransferase involved in cell wall biosynthesis
MKILALPRYGGLGSSSRLRIIQYKGVLSSSGVSIKILSLFSDSYILNLQNRRHNKVEIIMSYLSRLTSFFSWRKYDVLWIEKEIFPWMPFLFEWILLRFLKKPYILDYDDAVFYLYENHKIPLIRWLLKEKYTSLMKNASMVVVGNKYLEIQVKKRGATRVKIIPTVVELGKYSKSGAILKNGKHHVINIGWIGQDATGHYLKPYRDLFRKISSQYNAKFIAIGIDANQFNLPMQSEKWSESSEVKSLYNLDIGIMPLLDEKFERGKCGYKIIQYMACNLPVIASPVGVNKAIIKHGENGFLAKTMQEWEEYLVLLITNPVLRKEMGLFGAESVKNHYSIDITAPILIDVFKSVSKS